MHIKIIPELRSDWIIVINKENGRSMLLCRNNDVVGGPWPKLPPPEQD